MSDFTPNLDLPYILPNQAQKHVTHAEALRTLDALTLLAVRDDDRTDPPADPAEGDRHIVAAGALGAWAGHEFEIAAFQDGAWAFYPPREGWTAWVGARAELHAFSGGAWIAASSGGGGVEDLVTLGVNAMADETNRLTVAADSTLFTHDAADHRLVVNKAAAAATASLVLQSGFAGRAEIGLAGDDDLVIKVAGPSGVFEDALRCLWSDGQGAPQVVLGASAAIDPDACLEVHRADVSANFNRTSTNGGAVLGFFHRGEVRGRVSVGAGSSVFLDGFPNAYLRADGVRVLEALPDVVNVTTPLSLPVIAPDALPNASPGRTGWMVLVPGEAGLELAVCDGADWRYVRTLQIVV